MRQRICWQWLKVHTVETKKFLPIGCWGKFLLKLKEENMQTCIRGIKKVHTLGKTEGILRRHGGGGTHLCDKGMRKFRLLDW